MNLRERVLSTVGAGIGAKALYARLPTVTPAILDCAISALIRDRLLELSDGEYRRPGAHEAAPTARPRPILSLRTARAKQLASDQPRTRSEHEIRADLCCQLETMVENWNDQLRADRLTRPFGR